MTEHPSSSLTASVAQDELNGFLGLLEALGVGRCALLIADFGIADALGEAPATAAEVAARAGVNAEALGRIMRYAATFGVFEETGTGRFRHTVRSRLMRSDHPQSLRNYLRLLGPCWPVFGALDHSLRTGRPAVEALAPGGGWEWLAANPHFAKIFDLAMASKGRADLAALLNGYDFSRFRSFADIGGGQGHLLRAVLDQVPDATGTLFDQPAVVESVRNRLGNRVSAVGGDFFKDPLPRADAYLLMHVIHDWDDERAAAILRNIRGVAPPDARLLLIEVLLPQTSRSVRESSGSGSSWPDFLDFTMLAWTGGREHTRGEYERLLGAGGWHLERVVPTQSFMSVLEAAPVGE